MGCFIDPNRVGWCLLHIVNHALLKITFFSVQDIITMTGKERISELNGVGRRMPITMLALRLVALGWWGYYL